MTPILGLFKKCQPSSLLDPPTIRNLRVSQYWVTTSLKVLKVSKYKMLYFVGVPSSPTSTSTRTLLETVEDGGTMPNTTSAPNVAQRRRENVIGFDSFLHAVIILGLIMYYFYICDYVHLLPKANRTYSRDLFILFVILLFGVSGGLTGRECNGKLLNREQTEEWKGWMQVMFVWYHYFKAAEIYNAIRLFIAAYVWMTGFGKRSTTKISICTLKAIDRNKCGVSYLSININQSVSV